MEVDNLIHGHVELPLVLGLAFYQEYFLARWVKGIILRQFFSTFLPEYSFMVKSYRVGWGAGPCDSSVSPSPLGFDF